VPGWRRGAPCSLLIAGLNPIVTRRLAFTEDDPGRTLEVAVVILVVVDDPSFQSVVEETLTVGGFDPSIASSNEQALILLSGSHYRVLVIDIKLAGGRIRGWDVARRARATDPTLPVVYITDANADEWAVQGVPNSILLTRPFAPAQLVTAVSQLLNTGSPKLKSSD
jgi:DNA-binding response OmpR family regulator